MKDELNKLLKKLESRIKALKDDCVIDYLHNMVELEDWEDAYFIRDAITNLYSLETELKDVYIAIDNIVNSKGE